MLSPCLRWAWEGAKEYEDEYANTTKRDKGTLFHKAMEVYYNSRDKWLKVCFHDPEVTGWVRQAIAWSVEHLEPRCKEIHTEVYVAYNFTTGGVHSDPKVRDRRYPRKPDFMPGTCDLACVLQDETLLVADWKTGGGTGADKQLLTLALGLRDLYRTGKGGTRKVRLSVLYAGPDGVHPNEWEVTDEELAEHRTAMQFQLADVGKRTDPVPGIHCTQLYCNHLAYCPGISSTVEAAAESPEGLLQAKSLVRKYVLSEPPSSHEHAGSIMERVTAAKRQMEFYEKRVRSYCNDGGRAVAGDFEFSQGKDGFRWRPKKT